MTLEAVVFDLDDTLVFDEDTARASLRTVALSLGATSDIADDVILARADELWEAGPHIEISDVLGLVSWEGFWSDLTGCHPSMDGLRSWVPSFRREAWRRCLDDLGLDGQALAARAEVEFVEAQRSGHSAIPGAEELIRALAARGVRLGLLTNGPPDIQLTKVDSSGLSGHFHGVVMSGEVGLGKPDPAVFALVLDKLGVAPDRAVMVGDSWERDIVGGTRAGMHAVWISGGRTVPDDRVAGLVVESVAELTPELLEAVTENPVR